MKTTLTILILLLGISKAYSTGQYPDYLIQGQDTVPIFNNPLEQYFEKVGNRELIDFENPCWSTACWRGYKAYWELKNDSLFLTKVTSCHEDCNESKDANLFAMFGHQRPFASWYIGTLTAPTGELFSGSDMGYNAIFEFEDKLQIVNGFLKSKQRISNIELIEQVKLDNKLYAQIPTLKDTLFFYLNNNIDWEKIDDTDCDCSDSFILTYDKKGEIKKVEYIKLLDETDNLWYRLYLWRFDKKCSRRIKSAIKSLSLDYLNAHRDFKIEIELFYDKSLEISECRHYFRPISDEEIEEYVKRQMDIKE